MSYVVAALYKFARLENPNALIGPLREHCTRHQVCGTLLLAHEGINGTIAANRQGIDAVLSFLRATPALSDLAHKESYAHRQPFMRLKVRLKREIVTFGQAADPNTRVGTYVEPHDWDALIAQPDVTLIDTRNTYEVRTGRFKNAIDPNTQSFTEFPAFVAQHLDPQKNKRVAMYCTGGIRCEKASAYLLEQGFEEVYHLKGGILRYLETKREEHSSFEGECFVFDGRVSVKHGLELGSYVLCFGCQAPLSPHEQHRDDYEPGVACLYCTGTVSDEKRARLRERAKQLALAQQRGSKHIGDVHQETLENRQKKRLAKQHAPKPS